MDLIVPSKELLPPVTDEGVAILETLNTSWKLAWLNEGINLRKKTWPNESIYQQRRLHGRQTSPCSNSFHLWILRERVQLLSHEVKKGALNQIPSIMDEVKVRHSCRHEVNDGMGQKLSESPSLGSDQPPEDVSTTPSKSLEDLCVSKISLSGICPSGRDLKGTSAVEITEKLTKSLAQVALPWGIQSVQIVLPKSVNGSRIKENLNLLAHPSGALLKIHRKHNYIIKSRYDGYL
ncbi:hypothetical protein SADUNF_Sadunf06G0069900 [Salix dunnii]|uniref:Uncharacterized protein n=1 Tax=Salix dunnii TaxID=1413687 RepID=A0A835K0X9_9ROSI|nr:hypothetical protein SADUNF_Sadunf06G0069900 [Salix dunnii]